MATKTEKRQRERKKENIKNYKEKLANDEQTLAASLNFCFYHILYINDMVCNEALCLESKLKQIPYKGNGAKKLYTALKRRVQKYYEVYDGFELDQDSMSALFSQYDDIMNIKVVKLRAEIRKVLEERNIENADWIASVETVRTLYEYAKDLTKNMVDFLKVHDPKVTILNVLLPPDMLGILDDLCSFVQIAAHMGKININLNEFPNVITAMENLNHAFFRPENINAAIHKAHDEVKELGSTPLYI